MKTSILLLFLTVFLFQDDKTDLEKFSELEQKAMLLFVDEEYEQALISFEEALKLKPKKSVNTYFYATASALHLGKREKAKELLIASIHNTNTSKEFFLSFNEFDRFREDEMFSEIEKDYAIHVSIFYEKLEHPDIYREVDRLIELDQECRRNGSNRAKVKQIDSSNVHRLIEITKKYGWQPKGFIILWHQRSTFREDNEVWSFFRPFINDQIAKGNIKKDYWTIYEDDESINKEMMQIYGHYWSQFDKYPLLDIENVDKRRRENGLPPLWYMEKVYGIELPEGYKRP